MSTIKLKGSSSGEAEVTVAAAAGTPTFTLPTTVGSANQHLKTDGSGALSWATPTALTGSTNNTITTVTSANNIQGEANLTYDGTDLKITTDANGEGIVMYSSGSTFSKLSGDANRASENQSCLNIQANWDGTPIAAIDFVAGADTTNKDDGKIRFQTTTSGSNIAERMRIESDGNVKILDGDLLIGTAGHGIDFGATSDASGATSEKLDDYEEGTWTPTIRGYNTAGTGSYSSQEGTYTRIGNMVTVWYYINWTDLTGSSGSMCIAGLPYNVGGSGWQQTGSVMTSGLALSNDCVGLVTHQWPGSLGMLMFYQSRNGSQSWDSVGLDTAAAAIGCATYPVS